MELKTFVSLDETEIFKLLRAGIYIIKHHKVQEYPEIKILLDTLSMMASMNEENKDIPAVREYLYLYNKFVNEFHQIIIPSKEMDNANIATIDKSITEFLKAWDKDK